MANVLVIKLADGTIFQHRRLDNNYDGLDLAEIVTRHAQITGHALSTVAAHVVIDEAVLAGASSDEIGIINDSVVVDAVMRERRMALAVTDDKTARAITSGFTYEGKIFSLSVAAQNSLNGVWAVRAVLATFPLTWPTKDNLDSITLANQAAFEAFFAAAFAKVRLERDVGVAIKAGILNAASVIEIQAAVAGDTRP